MVVAGESGRGGTGLWSRKAIALQVAFVVVLAAAGAVLLSYLASLSALRARIDLTATASNTLDATLASLVEKLPEQVSIESFFRPVDPPLTQVGAEAQAKTVELLSVARSQFPDKLRVEQHDLTDVAKVAVRMQELGLEEDNVVVVTCGSRKVVLRLLRDLARVDPGNPTTKTEPTLAYLGEQALGSALLRASIDEEPRVLFTAGHGERDLEDARGAGGLGRLAAALAADGVSVGRWDGTREPEIPAGTRVVAIVDAQQPFSEAELATVQRFVDAGGRLLATPSSNPNAFGAPLGAEDLLSRYGIVVASGFVAVPVFDGFGGQRMGLEQCGTVVVSGPYLDRYHPVTQPLWSAGSRVVLSNVRALAAGPRKPVNAKLIDVLRSPDPSWRDLPLAGGRGDWKYDQRIEELGPFAVAVALSFAAKDDGGDDGERRDARILALGSSSALGNDQFAASRDLALNAFNWLAQREHRLVIQPRQVEARRLDLGSTRALAAINFVAFGALPGLCALLGIVIALRRRK